jgi:hypothetical protein
MVMAVQDSCAGQTFAIELVMFGTKPRLERFAWSTAFRRFNDGTLFP